MKLKSAPARFKAPQDEPTGGNAGEFEAIVSVFGNVDSWGDVVLPGAFTDTIAEWKAGPNTLPVLWSHRMDDPTFNIGVVTDMKELSPDDDLPEWIDPFVKDNGGLWVKGVIDTGPDASPIAVQALRLLKARRVTQFSYAYDEMESEATEIDGAEAWALKRVKLYEVSPTQIGANELTDLIAAKAGTMAKRKMRLTQDEADQMRTAVNAIVAALDSAEVEGAEDDTDTPDDGETGGEAGTDPAAAKAGNGRKVGRTLSQKNRDKLDQAHALLSEVLASEDDADKSAPRKSRGGDGLMVRMSIEYALAKLT